MLSLIQERIQSQGDCSSLLQGLNTNYARWVSNVGGSVALNNPWQAAVRIDFSSPTQLNSYDLSGRKLYRCNPTLS